MKMETPHKYNTIQYKQFIWARKNLQLKNILLYKIAVRESLYKLVK